MNHSASLALLPNIKSTTCPQRRGFKTRFRWQITESSLRSHRSIIGKLKFLAQHAPGHSAKSINANRIKRCFKQHRRQGLILSPSHFPPTVLTNGLHQHSMLTATLLLLEPGRQTLLTFANPNSPKLDCVINRKVVPFPNETESKMTSSTCNTESIALSTCCHQPIAPRCALDKSHSFSDSI